MDVTLNLAPNKIKSDTSKFQVYTLLIVSVSLSFETYTIKLYTDSHVVLIFVVILKIVLRLKAHLDINLW